MMSLHATSTSMAEGSGSSGGGTSLLPAPWWEKPEEEGKCAARPSEKNGWYFSGFSRGEGIMLMPAPRDEPDHE